MRSSVRTLAGLWLAVFMYWAPGCLAEEQVIHSKSRTVTINRVRLTEQQIVYLEHRFQMRVQEGSYWYDKVSGAWGLEGGPTVGFGIAGLNIGGPLRADSSRGNTGVFINGRELHWKDVMALQQLGPVYPGRYWVDVYGNCGLEGGPALLNLVQLARARRQAQGGSIVTGGGSLTFDADGKCYGQFKNPVGGEILTTP